MHRVWPKCRIALQTKAKVRNFRNNHRRDESEDDDQEEGENQEQIANSGNVRNAHSVTRVIPNQLVSRNETSSTSNEVLTTSNEVSTTNNDVQTITLN